MNRNEKNIHGLLKLFIERKKFKDIKFEKKRKEVTFNFMKDIEGNKISFIQNEIYQKYNLKIIKLDKLETYKKYSELIISNKLNPHLSLIFDALRKGGGLTLLPTSYNESFNVLFVEYKQALLHHELQHIFNVLIEPKMDHEMNIIEQEYVAFLAGIIFSGESLNELNSLRIMNDNYNMHTLEFNNSDIKNHCIAISKIVGELKSENNELEIIKKSWILLNDVYKEKIGLTYPEIIEQIKQIKEVKLT